MSYLTDQQKQVLKALSEPTLVIAGAGSGKTFTICEKIADIVKNHPHLHKVLAITFTNKAAKEMRMRLKKYEMNQQKVFVSTFHSFGLQLLQKFYPLIGYKKGFNLIDQQDKSLLLQELAPALCPKTLTEVLYQISWLKQLTDFKGLDQTKFGVSMDLFPLYQEALKKTNCFDLDDLVYQCWQLSKEPEVKETVRKTFGYWFIDEYQDTNLVQYHLFKNLSHSRHFTLVGDDDQSIYTWRGANPENLNLLNDHYCDLKVIKLTKNFRSTPQILDAANSLISHNGHLFEKYLESVHEPGKGLKLLTPVNEEEEVSDIIDRILSSESQSQAILVRTNFQALNFEKALRERGVAYQLLGAQSLFNKSELRDLICYLRILVNPDDVQAFKRLLNTPKRGLGPNTLEKIVQWSQDHQRNLYQTCLSVGLSQSLSPKIAHTLDHLITLLERYKSIAQQADDLKWINDLLSDIEYDHWLETLYPKKKTLEKKKKSLADCILWLNNLYKKTPCLDKVIKKIMILDMIDQQDLQKDKSITLATMHAAKGLEFDTVYIAGVIEDILPHHQSLENIEEERRLLYVGMTRAKLELTLSAPLSYQGKEAVKSRFIQEIGKEHFTAKEFSLSFDELRESLGY